MTTPRTTFASGVSPFTGKRADFTIVDDAPPTPSTVPGGKYTQLFEALPVGKAIACHTDEVDRVAAAMREWLRRRNLSGTLRVSEAKRYRHAKPGTPAGRVWLLERAE